MQLFDLPIELLDQIFGYAVDDRIFKRVMRLRLVNSQFKCLTDEAIYSSRVLDDAAFDPEINFNDAEHHDLPWTLYLRRYLERRIRQESHGETMRGQYRKVAECLWVAGSKFVPGLRFEDCIRDLSGVTVFINSSLETSALLKSTSGEDTFTQPQLATLFLNAAVYMGLEAIAKALIPEDPNEYWQCPTVAASTKPCLRSLIEMAAFRGHLGLVKHLVEIDKRIAYRNSPFMSPSVTSSILRCASIAGHMTVMEYALASSDLAHEHLTSTTRRNLGVALSYARSPDMYHRLVASLRQDISDVFNTASPDGVYAHLDIAARQGNTAIVRQILQQDLCLNQEGADTNPEPLYKPGCGSLRTQSQFRPLMSAVESGSVETVELLLWQGADPNWFPSTRTALMTAVHRGDMDMVRTLVENGARVDVGTPPPIVVAVQQESGDIFSYLESKGALRPSVGAWAMAYAQVFQLDSMVGLLNSRGFAADEVLHHTPSYEEAEYGRYLFRTEHYGVGTLELCYKSL
ncbi:ankyrin repeat-containing domain protein [Xylaria sp. CBS 124048]|nr:ankyrin repeat-containing domain protein [Xylaria sp. CBS 124048]